MAVVVKKVAVIGCGVSGLTATKCALDEGLEPTCFERADSIGGLWVYRENTAAGGQRTSSVFKSNVTNTSKEMMAFSDFPVPSQWPNYLRSTYVTKYCRMYAERFGLERHIRLGTTVTRLARAPDYDATGRWVVTTRRAGGGAADPVETDEELLVFDAVMVCIGIFNEPRRPEFPGLTDRFRGTVLHSQDYRRPLGFEDRRVLVVGFGNSAGDAAVDLSHCASQVFLSTRRGSWMVSRSGEYGIPTDLIYFGRQNLVLSEVREMTLKRMLRRRHDLVNGPLKPLGNPLNAKDRIVNDELPGCILKGSVVIKAAPRRFTETGVEFRDGSSEDGIDAVILATGYVFTFPFEVVDCPFLGIHPKSGRVPLYKHLFPLGERHHTLTVHGTVEPLGPVIPCVELQARWAARVFKGLARLPSQARMEADTFRSCDDGAPRFNVVTHTAYSDSVAAEIGALPSLARLFLSDPLLAIRCRFGPHLPYQYRLVGPGKWAGAREAICTVWERVLEPTRTRCEQPRDDGSLSGYTYILLCALILLPLFLFSTLLAL